MLSAFEIRDRLNLPKNDEGHLAIVPRPPIEALLERGGTSIDLRLGRWFRSFKPSRHSGARLWRAAEHDPTKRAEDAVDDLGNPRGLRTSEHFVPFGKDFVLHPGRFILGVTMEWLGLPKSISGNVTGKSSLGRHGLIIETAAGLHPGFSGCLTLELANVGEVPVAISPGMEICQIFLHEIKTDDPEGVAAAEGHQAAGGSISGTHETQPSKGSFSGQRKPAVALSKEDGIFNQLRRPDIDEDL